MPGVYAIVNTASWKVYVGSTVGRFMTRWTTHKWKLRKNVHESPYLQNAWNKYGEEAFTFEVLEELTRAEVIADERAREQWWLDRFREQGKVYNTGLVAANPMTGRPRSEETRRKLSAAHKGMKHSEETKQKMSTARKGKKKSEEHRRKLSEAKLGKKMPEKVALKQSKPYPALYNTKTGETIPEGVGRNQLARKLGVHQANLRHLIRGRIRSCRSWILVGEVQQLCLLEVEDA